jgi:hypothetical protein
LLWMLWTMKVTALHAKVQSDQEGAYLKGDDILYATLPVWFEICWRLLFFLPSKLFSRINNLKGTHHTPTCCYFVREISATVDASLH